MSTLNVTIFYRFSAYKGRLDFATRLVGLPVVLKPAFRVIAKDDLLAC